MPGPCRARRAGAGQGPDGGRWVPATPPLQAPGKRDVTTGPSVSCPTTLRGRPSVGGIVSPQTAPAGAPQMGQRDTQGQCQPPKTGTEDTVSLDSSHYEVLKLSLGDDGQIGHV